MYIHVFSLYQLGIFGCKLQKLISANLSALYHSMTPIWEEYWVSHRIKGKQNHLTLWGTETRTTPGIFIEDVYRWSLLVWPLERLNSNCLHSSHCHPAQDKRFLAEAELSDWSSWCSHLLNLCRAQGLWWIVTRIQNDSTVIQKSNSSINF